MTTPHDTTHPDAPLPEGEEAAPRGWRLMAIVRWALVAIMALAAGAAVAYHFGAFADGHEHAAGKTYYCPMHPSVVSDQPGECPICGMDLVERAPSTPGSSSPTAAPPAACEEPAEGAATHDKTVWTCPMDPEVVSDRPGECPKCGMNLVPKRDCPDGAKEDHAAHGVPGLVPVTVTADRVQLIGMRTAPVTKKKLTPELRTVGIVTADENRLARIQTRFSGWLEELYVAETGQQVKKGQVLATIYSPEVLQAQEEWLNARRWAAAGEAGGVGTVGLEEAARRRLELLGVSKPELDEIARTGKPLRALPIRSPVSGYVTQKQAIQGLYLEPAMTLFEIADLSTVWVLADVYEHDVGRVSVGQHAVFTLPAFPGETFHGKVTFLAPTLDPATRTLRARLEFRNRDLRLRPGLFGDVTLSLAPAEGLVIPAEALVDVGTMTYVFVSRPGGRFEPRRVTVGARAGDEVQIAGGLDEGEVVVTTGNFLLDSESRLQASFEAQGGAPPAGDHAGHGR